MQISERRINEILHPLHQKCMVLLHIALEFTCCSSLWCLRNDVSFIKYCTLWNPSYLLQISITTQLKIIKSILIRAIKIRYDEDIHGLHGISSCQVPGSNLNQELKTEDLPQNLISIHGVEILSANTFDFYFSLEL